MTQQNIQDGGLIRSYSVASWVILRLYGASFAYIAYLGLQWKETDHPSLAALSYGLDPLIVIGAMAFVGICLLVPFLTPRFMAVPDRVSMGAVKALVIAALSVWLYLGLGTVLTSGIISHGREFAALLPMLLKAVAGMAITGAILISFAKQLTKAEAKRSQVVETPQPMAMQDLRALRQARMQ